MSIWEKNIDCDKVGDLCLLTGNYRGLAHSNCNFNVTKKQSNFKPFLIHIFSNYDCHLFFKKLVDKKKNKVKFEIIPKTDETKLSVKYGYFRFLDSYKFVSSSLH